MRTFDRGENLPIPLTQLEPAFLLLFTLRTIRLEGGERGGSKLTIYARKSPGPSETVVVISRFEGTPLRQSSFPLLFFLRSSPLSAALCFGSIIKVRSFLTPRGKKQVSRLLSGFHICDSCAFPLCPRVRYLFPAKRVPESTNYSALYEAHARQWTGQDFFLFSGNEGGSFSFLVLSLICLFRLRLFPLSNFWKSGRMHVVPGLLITCVSAVPNVVRPFFPNVVVPLFPVPRLRTFSQYRIVGETEGIRISRLDLRHHSAFLLSVFCISIYGSSEKGTNRQEPSA